MKKIDSHSANTAITDNYSRVRMKIMSIRDTIAVTLQKI